MLINPHRSAPKQLTGEELSQLTAAVMFNDEVHRYASGDWLDWHRLSAIFF